MYHFFVQHENIFDDSIIIDGDDVNHIKNVLRMKVGEQVLLSSGDNYDYLCEIDNIDDNRVVSRIIEKKENTNELPCKVYLFQGLPKADKMELIIQKTVELGIFEIIPVAMKRCVVKLDDKKSKSKVERWQAISESAAKQSKRSIIPSISNVMTYKQALEYAKSLDVLLLPYECADGIEYTRKCINDIKPGQSVGIFVGPEGGFELDEVEAGIAAGCKEITLGKRILRTETVGMMMMSVLSYNLEE